MHVDFSGDTAGNAPATDTTQPPAYPVSKPSGIGGYGPFTTNDYGDNPLVASDGTAVVNNVGSLNKALVMSSDVNNGEQGAVYADTSYSQTSNYLKLSFDVNVQQQATTNTAQTFHLNSPTGPTTGMIFGVNQFSDSGSPIFGFAIAPNPGSDTAGVFALRNPNLTEMDSFGTYAVGDTNHIDIIANYGTDTVDAYLNGTLALSDFPMKAGFTSNVLDETFMFVNGQADSVNSVAIDNIQASVPEPSTCGLIAVTGGALLMRRRRRRTA